jgi:hypothetical protein
MNAFFAWPAKAAPLLAEAAAAAEPGTWFGIDSLFFLTILFIFATAVVTAIYTRWAKDKCLKLLQADHVTLERGDGVTIWGRLTVLSEGVEVSFEVPAVDHQGRQRSSVMIYPEELAGGKSLGFYRAASILEEEATSDRRKQVERTFHPGFFRRTWRKVRILINTLRDAFSKSLGLIVGQVAKANPQSRVLAAKQGEMTQIGDTLLTHGVAANAYEPLLEQHIGKPVIVDLKRSDGSVVGIAGYLAEYTARYVAIFNVEHEAGPVFELKMPEDDGSDPCMEQEVEVTMAEGRLVVKNLGIDGILVEKATRDGFEPLPIRATIPPRGLLRLPGRDLGGATLSVSRLRRYDLIAPRATATVRHAGELLPRRSFLDDLGLDELPLVPKPSPDQEAT